MKTVYVVLAPDGWVDVCLGVFSTSDAAELFVSNQLDKDDIRIQPVLMD